MSFNDDTKEQENKLKEQENKLGLVDCELQSFSFDEVSAILIDEIENKEDK
jgi:hypothetical protein